MLADFADYGDLLPPGFVKDTAMAAGAGAVGLGLSRVATGQLMKLDALAKLEEKPKLYASFGITALLGLVGARLLYNTNREAAMGVAGAAIGAGLEGIGLTLASSSVSVMQTFGEFGDIFRNEPILYPSVYHSY